jgi:methylmalonyl-CoA/ethylmalonyl-CoA epimerase
MCKQPLTPETQIPADTSGMLHHVGFVIASIEGAAADFARSVGAVWDGSIVQDPVQQVKVSFIEPAAPGGWRIELIEPAGDSSRVARFLVRSGGGLHHLCYEVDDVLGALRHARSCHSVVLRAPQPAAAFGGRRIAWARNRQGLLIEYLER